MSTQRLLLITCSLALTMCAARPQTGIMTADWTPPIGSGIAKQKVIIGWESHSHTTGNMTFTLGAGGEHYVGSYLLIEKTASHVNVQPLYDVWDRNEFSEWTGSGAASWFEPAWGISTWVEHYDGRVVVGLHGNRNGTARCHFTLTDTSHGLLGGGEGECQVDDGSHLDIRF